MILLFEYDGCSRGCILLVRLSKKIIKSYFHCLFKKIARQQCCSVKCSCAVVFLVMILFGGFLIKGGDYWKSFHNWGRVM